jgi:hypothetical protein
MQQRTMLFDDPFIENHIDIRKKFSQFRQNQVVFKKLDDFEKPAPASPEVVVAAENQK